MDIYQLGSWLSVVSSRGIVLAHKITQRSIRSETEATYYTACGLRLYQGPDSTVVTPSMGSCQCKRCARTA